MATATLIHTDEEIQKDVLAELKWDAQVQPNEIGVSVKDGVVTLSGWVDSYLKKWAAEDAALRFVEETGTGRGRSRPWRVTSASSTFETDRTGQSRMLCWAFSRCAL